LPSFLVSWLLTFTLASLFHSQYVVNQLVNVGVVVLLSDAIAFFVTAKLNKKVQKYGTQLFIIAGIVAFAIVLIAIESIMNIHIIAGARGWGFYAQLLAGAVGGFAFSQLFKVTKNQKAC